MYEEEFNEAQNPPQWITARKASAIALAMESRWHYWTAENVQSVTTQPLTNKQCQLLAAECNAVDPHGLDYKTLSVVFAELREANQL